MDASTSIGVATYQITDHLAISNTFGASEIGRKAVCLNPHQNVAGVQLFIAFDIPKIMPSGTAVEVVLTDNLNNQVITAIRSVGNSLALELASGSQTDSTAVTLAINTKYLILVAVDSSATMISAQVIDTKNAPLATITIYPDDTLSSAIVSEQFYTCVSVSHRGARKIRQAKDVAINVHYYGAQSLGVLGTLSKKTYTGISGGAVAGAVIGSLIGALVIGACFCIAICALVIFVKQKPVKKQETVLELTDLENPPIVQEAEPVYDTIPAYDLPVQVQHAEESLEPSAVVLEDAQAHEPVTHLSVEPEQIVTPVTPVQDNNAQETEKLM
jgi:hypothetical protein